MAQDKIKVLFVCTGNIFRSLSAEYALRDYLNKHNIKNIVVDSAGTEAKPEPPHEVTINSLKKHKIVVRNHRQKKVTKKLLSQFDIVIAMAKDHQEYMLKKFNVYAPLFNELAFGSKSSVKDLNTGPKDYLIRKSTHNYIKKIVSYIYKAIPKLYGYLEETHFLFSHFVKKRKRHANGFPFIPLYETKHSIAFMSIDIPQKEDGHVLVIPKERYSHLEDIPKKVLSDLSSCISIVGKALIQTNQGYNVLLNNGRSAGQYIFHTHFHMIPRNKGDKIKIEVFRRRKVTPKEFIDMNNKVKKQIDLIVSRKKN